MIANTGVLSYRSADQLNTAMAGVYKHMGLAVLTSMNISVLVAANTSMMALLFGTSLKWIVILAPLVAIFAISLTLYKVSKSTAIFLLHGFAALMGLSMAAIFASYTTMSVFTAFMGAAVLFSVMSFYGYFTRQSLDNLGKWMFVGLISIVIASIINLFIGSSLAQMVISALAIVIFMGLTAYDTQRIREELSVAAANNAEVSGALSLYINFINIFTSLLTLFGNKNE